MLPAKRFDELSEPNKVISAEPSQLLAATRDDPSRITLKGKEANFLECIHDCANRDDSVVRALKELGTERGLHGNEWQEKDGLVLYRGKIYVPCDSQL